MSQSLNIIKDKLEELPNNIEAEQSVIGSILLSNEIFDEIRDLLSGLLSPIEKENFLGYAKIKQVFKISNLGKIAGCIVTEGAFNSSFCNDTPRYFSYF